MRNKPIPESWTRHIAAWQIAARAAGQPATTISTRSQHLGQLSRAFPEGPNSITAAALLLFAGGFHWAPETRRGRYATYRRFFALMYELGVIAEDPSTRLPAVKPAQPHPRPAPDWVYGQALMKADPRSRLMLRLAAEVGLRRAEVAQVHSRDILEDLGGYSLHVHGKGGRRRTVPLPRSLATEIRAHGPGPLFPGADGGHLSPRWVGKIITSLLPGEWTMHTLRHRCATRAYAVDRDVFVVQELLGHASPATTRRYVSLPQDALRATVDAISA